MKTTRKPLPKKLEILPRVPSKLLGLAIRDIIRTRKNRRMRIDMGTWHYLDPDDKTCTVCFAGAVMHYGLKGFDGFWTSVVGDNYSALMALNEFRTGNVEPGCTELGITTTVKSREVFNYCDSFHGTEQDFRRFINDMRKLKREFKEAGQ